MLCKQGLVNYVSTEDMDALPFGSPRVLKGFKTNLLPIQEIDLENMLSELGLSYEEFVDLCILVTSSFKH